MKTDKFGILMFILIVLLLLTLAAAARAQKSNAGEISAEPLTGGAFTIGKSVVAGGGTFSKNQSIEISGTIGQAVAGDISTGGQFSLHSGFWTPENFAPTATTVTVGGRVTATSGLGIRNVLVTITFPSGETRTTLSGSGGNYRFGDVEVGGVYIFSISGKRFVFSNPVQILNINEERNDINFVADN